MEIARARPDHRVWLPAICLIGCVGVFVWASDRGYDINDEAYYLVWAFDPYSYHISISQFGYLWHPIYRLVEGNIGLFRIVSASALLICAITFASALNRFSDDHLAPRSENLPIVLGLGATIFWFFATWVAVPGYNELNLCALLLFFSGLMFATPESRPNGKKSFSQTIYPALLSGASVGVIALVKPPTCIAAIALGLGWLVLLRPPRALFFFCVSVISAVVVLSISIWMIDGSFAAFLRRLFVALEIYRLMGRPGDIHGIVNSILGPFSQDRIWKIFPAIALGAAIFGICYGICAMATGQMKRDKKLQRIASYSLIVTLGIYVAVARQVDLQAILVWYNFHAWYFTFPIMAGALMLLLILTESIEPVRWKRQLAAAALVGSAPIAYSFGTDVTLLRHMVGASVFWAGSAMLICAMAPPDKRTELIGVTTFLCGAVTIGLLTGVVLAPLASEAPLFQQTQPLTVGPDGARLFVDPATAGYIKSFQHMAGSAGFRAGMPIIDLSEFGPGIVFALSGSVPGLPWLGDHPDASMRAAVAVLKPIPQAQLRRAWIITGSDQNYSQVRIALRALGLNFPNDYRIVAASRLDAVEWQHSLWKPVMR